MRRTRSAPNLAYRVEGDAGTPVLMIMGLGMRGEVWKPQVDSVKEHHRTVTYDHRGVGGSDKGRRRLWDMRTMADDAARVLDDAGLDRAHVVGVSLGGMIAQEFACRYPDRMRSASFIATLPGGPLGWLPPAEGALHFARSFVGPSKDRIKHLQRLLYPDEFVERIGRAAMQQGLESRFSEPAPLSTIAAQLSAVLRHDVRSRLPDIDVPTLVVRPGSDVLIRPTRNDAIVRLVPGARLAHFEGAGHGLTFQCAAKLNETLLDHFAEVDRGEAYRGGPDTRDANAQAEVAAEPSG